MLKEGDELKEGGSLNRQAEVSKDELKKGWCLNRRAEGAGRYIRAEVAEVRSPLIDERK